jgi:hypothetical protein
MWKPGNGDSQFDLSVEEGHETMGERGTRHLVTNINKRL